MESKGPRIFFRGSIWTSKSRVPGNPSPQVKADAKPKEAEPKTALKVGHKKRLVEKPWEVLEVFGKFQESAQLQKACQLLNNINDIDNINDMFFDKDIVNISMMNFILF